MKKISLIIFSLILLQSCVISDLQKVDKDYTIKKILNDTSTSYMYKAEIHVYDNYFSGLIIIKPLKTGHRIVFMNEIGMKFFDFELNKDAYTVHQIFAAMNKKIFVKLLVSDFKHILMNNTRNDYSFFKNTNEDSFILKPNKYKELYYFNIKDSALQRSEKYSIFRKHTFTKYGICSGEIPDKIAISHKNIKFEMNLKYIKPKNDAER